MPYSSTILEEELKNKVAQDYFQGFDSTKIVGKIDFCISKGEVSFLWAEAKAGVSKDIYESFVQLILTIGNARTFEKILPPSFLGAFDAEKIAFLPYHYVITVFAQNDFNWNVAPSDHDTKEFKQLYAMISETIEQQSLLFYYHDPRLPEFIKNNFKTGLNDYSRMEITRNNFISVYYKWIEIVKPTIIINWENAKKIGLLDADFYLADLISKDNMTLSDKLFVLLQDKKYEFVDHVNTMLGLTSFYHVNFRDGQKAHKKFWNYYVRPPKKEYSEYIIKHRELLVPQDVRERKGSYFTPPQWVKLSQKYLAEVLGANWQNEYYVWDCAAGTGNLLEGLTNPYNIWASTLDQADVDVMKERIAKKGAMLLEPHVFQFDFLNDSFDKLPQQLLDIINDPEKRKKLVIYINPPYAEAANKRTPSGTGEHRKGITGDHLIAKKYGKKLGLAKNELFSLFLIRMYIEIHGCIIAHFSTSKILQSPGFAKFRNEFVANLKRMFMIPANTFDNVSGLFPIGFFIWKTCDTVKNSEQIIADVYQANGELYMKKNIYIPQNKRLIMDWLRTLYDKKNAEKRIAYLRMLGSDFQSKEGVFITLNPYKNDFEQKKLCDITVNNLYGISVYYTVRHSISATWLNNHDQFLYPNDTWETDTQFQTDCLAYILFSNKNYISAKHGVNHWIPFTEMEVRPQDNFSSHFMTDYMQGKIKAQEENPESALAKQKSSIPTAPLPFSPAAQAVFDAGRELWKYYHSKVTEITPITVNASLYDIKEYFQGRSDKGRMKPKSEDEQYNVLIGNLREKLKLLADQIEPKVYEHGFLKK